MALKPFNFLSLILLLFLALSSSIGHAYKGDNNIITGKKAAVVDFMKLVGSQKGNKSEGIQRLKLYLKEFGYLPPHAQIDNDYFDNALESAIRTYQKNFKIKPASGTLDAMTVSTMMAPRCGVPDIINGTNHMQPRSGSRFFHMVSLYSFFPGSPRWSKRQLSYRFLPGFPTAAMPPVRRAFQRWTTATGYFSFSEVPTNQGSDLTIGFYRGAHGDNAPFDGPGGTLAHAYSPTDGRFHYDADERWSVGPGPVPNNFDLESVAVHEIGHLLGLGHSQFQQAIMFPSIAPGTTKTIPQSDDIQGIRALYRY